MGRPAARPAAPVRPHLPLRRRRVPARAARDRRRPGRPRPRASAGGARRDALRSRRAQLHAQRQRRGGDLPRRRRHRRGARRQGDDYHVRGQVPRRRPDRLLLAAPAGASAAARVRRPGRVVTARPGACRCPRGEPRGSVACRARASRDPRRRPSRRRPAARLCALRAADRRALPALGPRGARGPAARPCGRRGAARRRTAPCVGPAGRRRGRGARRGRPRLRQREFRRPFAGVVAGGAGDVRAGRFAGPGRRRQDGRARAAVAVAAHAAAPARPGGAGRTALPRAEDRPRRDVPSLGRTIRGDDAPGGAAAAQGKGDGSR